MKTKKVDKYKECLTHLKENGSLTSWQAIILYKATRLSSYIHTMKRRGFNIKSKRKTNNGVSYVKYIFIS